MRDTEAFVSAAGVPMPRLIYGTAWKKTETAGLVRAALDLGFRGIDTACQPKHYDEAAVGDGLAAALQAGLAREAVYVQTKFTPLSGQDPQRLPYDASASLTEQVRQSCAASLRNLRLTQIDALVLHSPLRERADLREVWNAMQSCVDAGHVRQLGISNCYDLGVLEAVYREATIKPAVVQNRFYADTRYDREIRAFCRGEGVIYQSFWTLSANPAITRQQHPAGPGRGLRDDTGANPAAVSHPAIGAAPDRRAQRNTPAPGPGDLRHRTEHRRLCADRGLALTRLDCVTICHRNRREYAGFRDGRDRRSPHLEVMRRASACTDRET